MNYLSILRRKGRNVNSFLAFLLFVCLSVLPAMAQQDSNITLDVKNETVENVFKTLGQQTGLKFFYDQDVVSSAPRVTIQVKNASLQSVLNQISSQTQLSFNRDNNTITVGKKQHVNTVAESTGKRTISGVVLDSSGMSIIGANVHVKGTTNGVITDVDGNYTLEGVSPDDIITISYIGYKSMELQANSKDLAKVILKEDNEVLDEVIVIGYGTQSKAKVTGAISKLEGDKLVGDLVVSSFDQALASKLPGVNISQATGAPGAGVNIKIRGTSSINYGGHPLIVVDGLPLSNSVFDEQLQGKSTISNFQSSYTINPMSSINPSDIESIDVLKDAASTAIYGSRGSNGVIMITTKKGKVGKPVVNFNMYAGVQMLSKKVDVMDAYELANYTKLSRDEAWVAVGGNANDPLSVRTGANYIYPDYMLPYIEGKTGLTNTDWQDEIYRTALQQNYDISIGGGNEDFRYYFLAIIQIRKVLLSIQA